MAKSKITKDGNVKSIENKVAEVNRLIKLAVDRDGEKIPVVDETGSWQSPMKYKPLRYSNGVLYVEYEELDLYLNNKTGTKSWKIHKDKVLKRDMDSDSPLNQIAKMYRKALKQNGIMFECGGSVDEVDLFEDFESLPNNVVRVLFKYSDGGEDYQDLESMLSELEPLGYTFDYGLDAVPYDLRPIGSKGKSEDCSFANGGKVKEPMSDHQMKNYIIENYGISAGGLQNGKYYPSWDFIAERLGFVKDKEGWIKVFRSHFAKGGSLPKNKYVRNSDIKEITLSLDGVEKTIKGKDILDGVHVKTGSKDGYEIKPHKEVKANQAIAIKEVLDGFKQFRDLGEMEAGMLYALRDKDVTEVVQDADFKGLKGGIYQKLVDKFYIEEDGYGSSATYSLEDRAKDFIDKVEARLATRRGVKAGTDMFPETANIPELKLKRGGKMTGDWRTYYYLVVDMDERGSYGATVYPAQENLQVWDCDEETVAELIEDGFLKYKPHEDLEGLSKYLSDMKIIRKGAEIISEEDFKALKDNDKVIEFDIPEWAVSALINGDFSGMDDEDEKDLNEFTDEIVEKYGHAHFSLPSLDEQLEHRFQHGNDIRGNEGGDVVTLYLLPSKEYKSGGSVSDSQSNQSIFGAEFINIFGV